MQTEEDNSFSSDESPKDQSLTEVSTMENIRVDLQIDLNRKTYGNMVVLAEKPFLLTLGPDYICFLCGFIFFAALGYTLCYVVTLAFENIWVIYSTYFLSILQCGSYLLVAFSNPSIATKEENPIPIHEVTKQNQHLTCNKCGAESRRTYHCRDCDVCVRGYDHHCPWTSKCIGEGNLYRFYLFVTVTPIYILAFMGLMFGCLILSAQKANHNLRESAVKSLL